MFVLFGYLAALVIVGAILCFKGKKLFRPAIAIFAFWMVYSGVVRLFSDSMTQQEMIIAILAGLVAALLSGFVLKLGVFLAGIVLGGFVGMMVLQLFPQLAESDVPALIYIAVIAILVAVLCVKAMDIVIIVATAGLGASLIAIPCVYMVLDLKNLTDTIASSPEVTIAHVNQSMFQGIAMHNPLIILATTVILFVVGFSIQWKNKKNES